MRRICGVGPSLDEGTGLWVAITFEVKIVTEDAAGLGVSPGHTNIEVRPRQQEDFPSALIDSGEEAHGIKLRLQSPLGRRDDLLSQW
jgi:hypothetical protein